MSGETQWWEFCAGFYGQVESAAVLKAFDGLLLRSPRVNSSETYSHFRAFVGTPMNWTEADVKHCLNEFFQLESRYVFRVTAQRATASAEQEAGP